LTARVHVDGRGSGARQHRGPHPPQLRVSRGPPLLLRNVQRFRGGLVFKAHRLLYHSTLDVRVIKKKKKVRP